MQIQCASRNLDLSVPKIMGILNVTPDSFSDGGKHYRNGRPDRDAILRSAAAMVAEGADIVDIGGESTRPGAAPVSLDQECDRVLPVVEWLASELDVVLSVDSSSPELMTAAAALGAGLLNDVRALTRPGALEAAVATGLPVCLMHMRGAPSTMQHQPEYLDPVTEVMDFLQARKAACLAAGLKEGQILVDPGIGFGKTIQHNLALIRHLDQFRSVGPVLLGVSRKSMFERLLGRDVGDRLAGSLATAAFGLQRGAQVLRVHDVAATKDLVKMYLYIEQGFS